VSDVRQTEFYDPARAAQYGAESFICVPVKLRGEVVAVINITDRIGGARFTANDLSLMNAMTAFASLALENATLQDTTAELKDLFRDLLDSLSTGVVAVDPDGAVTCWSQGAESLLGLPARLALGRRLFSLIPGPVADRLREALAACAQGEGSACCELEWPSGNGGRASIPLGVTITPLRRRAGSPGGHVMVFEDLSLNRAYAELKRVDELKSNFVAIVSHELRTPLTSMRGSLHLLTTMCGSQLDAPGRQMLEILRTNTERLIHHVNNLLEVTQLQNRSVILRRELYDVCGLVDRCVEDLRLAAEKRRVVVRVTHLDRPLMVDVDMDKIKLVLRHLLDNAIKFSPVGGAVDVTTAPECDTVRIVVRDTGGGIGEEFSKQAFDRFTQIEPAITRASTGVGLGLYISRELTRLHGGTVEIVSTGPKGTEIALTLPRRRV